jgi:hypothetical protein
MGRAKLIHEAMTQGLDEHYRVLENEKIKLRCVKIVVWMDAEGQKPDHVIVSPECVKQIMQG